MSATTHATVYLYEQAPREGDHFVVLLPDFKTDGESYCAYVEITGALGEQAYPCLQYCDEKPAGVGPWKVWPFELQWWLTPAQFARVRGAGWPGSQDALFALLGVEQLPWYVGPGAPDETR